MKNTKKYLSTGVALVITLFAAVQITAMERRTVNPYLNEETKRWIQREIKMTSDVLDPKSQNFFPDTKYLNKVRARLKGFEEVYYGNKPYTYQEIDETIDKYWDLAKEENRRIKARENQ